MNKKYLSSHERFDIYFFHLLGNKKNTTFIFEDTNYVVIHLETPMYFTTF